MIETKTTVGEISAILLNFGSILVSILLAIFVYFQSERINTLEATQYDVFIGVEKIDSSASFATEMVLLSKNNSNLSKYAKLFETTCDDNLALYAYVHISDKSENTFLPFIFITRNTPLITAIIVKKISVTLDCHENENYQKDFPLDSLPVYKFLSDENRFLFGLGIHGVDKKNIEKGKIQIEFEIEDQIGRTHEKTVELCMVKLDKELRLISSKSK